MATPRPQSDAGPIAGDSAPMAMSLTKRGHLWRFSCAPGDEASLVRALAEMADDDACDLDWFDAALVAYELGRRLEASAARSGATHTQTEDHHRPHNRSTVQP